MLTHTIIAYIKSAIPNRETSSLLLRMMKAYTTRVGTTSMSNLDKRNHFSIAKIG